MRKDIKFDLTTTENLTVGDSIDYRGTLLSVSKRVDLPRKADCNKMIYKHDCFIKDRQSDISVADKRQDSSLRNIFICRYSVIFYFNNDTFVQSCLSQCCWSRKERKTTRGQPSRSRWRHPLVTTVILRSTFIFLEIVFIWLGLNTLKSFTVYNLRICISLPVWTIKLIFELSKNNLSNSHTCYHSF